MELQTKTLDILFRRLSPEHLIRLLLDSDTLPDAETFRSIFLEYAESTLSGYSKNEQESILSHFSPRMGKNNKENSLLLPFYLLGQAGDRFLTAGVNGPECLYGEVMHWREAYFLLGQDLFTCSWLARKPERRIRDFFSWPNVIPTNNRILCRLTEDAAENHMHLYAAASVFPLSWACLMNHPEPREKEGLMETLLQPRESRGVTGNLWTMRRKALYAAFLRAKLFSRVNGVKSSMLYELRQFDRTYFSDEATSYELKEEFARLRHIYGIGFEQPNYRVDPVCLDYAFTRSLSAEREENSRLLAGERRLLFDCFVQLYEGEFSLSEQLFFYLYLLLKAQFRSEMIQVNQQRGFANFRDYDSRKKIFWRGYPEYSNEVIRQSINAGINEQKLLSLEARICPEDSSAKNLSVVHEIDCTALYFGSLSPEEREKLLEWEVCSCMTNYAQKQNYFYVLHFPKEPDKEVSADVSVSLLCRHDEFRQKLRSDGIELAKSLVNCQYFCERVRGIDACSQELVCRPEVFATLFRFLRSFRPEDYWNGMLQVQTPRLSATYHVGEDFYDIADGLRAMDEVLYFLDFRHGDRFGHALALGVDPIQHYKCKFNQSVLPKQNLLDDLVWIYYRSSELGVLIPDTLRHRIRAKMYTLFDHIYRQESPDSCFTLREYYDSMFLRGDDPRCYSDGEYKAITVLDQYDLFCKNPIRDDVHPIEEFRENKRIARLYHLYHYCLSAKRRGAETDIWKVDSAYISLMKNLQRAMRELISRKGISIECNPSSNVLIGTFDTYQDHPILTFNTMGLTNDVTSTQMHVSINTDDPGVFDTSLSFEYALLARALSDMEDEHGHPLYSERQIEEYLRNIVRMGREQVFPPCFSLDERNNRRMGLIQ